MRKNLFWGILLFLICRVWAGEFVLVDQHRPCAVLVLPGEKYRAVLDDFNATLKTVCGTPLKIVEKAGRTERQIRFEIRPDADPRTEDAFSIEFPEEKTMVVKCSETSMVWALNHLLERFAGVRWLFPEKCGLSYLPLSRIALPVGKISEAPSFNIGRFIERSNPAFYPKAYFKPPIELNHALTDYVFPLKKYRETGFPPEIMPVLKGAKIKEPPNRTTPRGYWQPCYSNPASVRIAVENILEYLKEHPEKTSISLSVNDCGGFCECRNCEHANGGRKYSQSEVYYKWVNAVAEAVASRVPKLILTANAYVQTAEPPSFKLHPNVIVNRTIDLYSCTDPATMRKHKETISEWSRKAAALGVWDYSWGHGYMMPRVYFRIQAEMLQFLHSKNVRVYFGENECFDCRDGGKTYLYSKLLWNIRSDPDKILAEWYERCAGKNAAPLLRKYYERWEEIFSSPEMRRTPWFESVGSTYMNWGKISHIYALRPGDLEKLRGWIEDACRLAGNAQEKERLEWLRLHFNYMEALLKMYGAEFIPPEGVLSSSGQALALLNSFSKLPEYVTRKKKFAEQLKKEPVMGFYYRSPMYSKRMKLDEDVSTPILSQLETTLDFLDSPEVAGGVAKIAEDKAFPPSVRDIADALVRSGSYKNIFPEGDMEQAFEKSSFRLIPEHRRTGSGILSSDFRFSGKKSFKIIPDEYGLVRLELPADPDSGYVAAFRTFVPEEPGKATLQYGAFPALNSHNQDWYILPRKKLSAGVWQKWTLFVRTNPKSNGINFYLFFRDFAPGKAVYVDDMRVVKAGKQTE